MSPLWPTRGNANLDYISPPPSESFSRKFPRKISVLGSTGSIGRNALAIVEQFPRLLQVCALAGGKNAELLARQALAHNPDWLAVADEETAERLCGLLPQAWRSRVLVGPAGYEQLAALAEADIVVGAQSGFAGLGASVAAAQAGKVLALANKESLVIAGPLLRRACAATGASILPIDSEHYALFQCCAGRGQSIASLVLTASGGPFRGKDRAWLAQARPEDALKNPNWKMGAKISIDSATLLNKGFEVLEARQLYGLADSQIEVVVHPESVVHSLARFRDNSLLAQISVPDMRLPISGCLLWPECGDAPVAPLDLAGSLSFEKPDTETFPCLNLARSCGKAPLPESWRNSGVNPYCVGLNAASEAVVQLFLEHKCGFNDIPVYMEKTLAWLDWDSFQAPTPKDCLSGARLIDKLSALDNAARDLAANMCAKQTGI